LKGCPSNEALKPTNLLIFRGSKDFGRVKSGNVNLGLGIAGTAGNAGTAGTAGARLKSPN